MKNKRIKISLILIIMFLFIFNINKINAIDELPDNSAKISSAVVTQTKTGTGPFDENDEPGNDSSEDNNIVRSFDEVTWTIESTIALKDENTTSYSGGRIYFEATLPDVFTSETIKWNLDSMVWVENGKISSDGLTLTGYYSMPKDDISVPGKQTLVFTASVLGAKNGIELQPTIKLWLNGNLQEEYYSVIPETVYISSYPKYNVKIVRNSDCAARTTVNIDGKDVTGRMYGYAIVYQLYNDDISKGLKGLENPQGDIKLDLEMIIQKKESSGGTLTDISDEVTPILWNYQLADNGSNGLIQGRKMFTGASSFVYTTTNFAPGGKIGNRKSFVLDTGNVKIEQNGNILSTTISDYKFDGIFPTHNYAPAQNAAPAYTSNIGCFGSVYFQILFPDWDEYEESAEYYLKVNDTNFSATSLSNKIITNEIKTNDDSTSVKHVKSYPSSYTSLVYISKRNGNTIGSSLQTQWNSGDGRAFIGQELFLNANMEQSNNNDPENNPRTINCLFKFDGDCYQPVVLSDGRKFTTNPQIMTFKMWYVTKKDGTNWSNQKEMNDAIVSDCNLYENLENIPDNQICVGVYYESQSGVFNVRDMSIYVPVVIKDTAKINQTYGITQKVQYYNYALDRSIYTAVNENVNWPNDYVYNPKRDYVKAEYDENGAQISGTHVGGTYYGNTVQVIGANQRVQISPIDNKANYDFSKNEYNVTYKIKPTLSNTVNTYSEEINDVAVVITSVLPNGLTYIPNSSNYGEPNVTVNNDGSTNLEWTISGCSVNEDIKEITFDAHIDEESLNGKQYNVSAQIHADPEKVGTEKLSDRVSNTTINIINLSSHRLYNITDTPVIEKNGEIHYMVTYKNNTDEVISDFQMLDILPYNGDARGTEYIGDYILDRIVVTQQNENGEKISNDNLEILYTNDERVRSGVTSKDENLGSGWNSITSEILSQKATAYVVKGEIEAKGNVTVDIYLKTNGNKGLDKYVNSVTAQVYKETEEMTTSNVVSQVVKRSIEGIAWDDSNRNGVKDEGEKVVNNVEMTLTDELGQQITDVNGNNVTNIKTDDNGYYKFENLPKGNYYVQVTMPNKKYELTEKAVGTNNEINSKFNKEENETDKITYLNSIDLPELTVSHVNAGFVKIEGSIDITKVDKKNNSKVIEGATFKLERIDDTGNVDSTFDAEEKTTNSEGKVEFTGLEVGKYKITEIQAPEGYELLKDSIEVNITGESRDIKLLAQNELKIILPETGSINNIAVFIVLGIVIIAVSIVLNKIYKNKKIRT